MTLMYCVCGGLRELLFADQYIHLFNHDYIKIRVLHSEKSLSVCKFNKVTFHAYNL